MKIRPIKLSDRTEWLRLRCLLWPDSDADHNRETAAFFRNPHPNLAIFVIDCGEKLSC